MQKHRAWLLVKKLALYATFDMTFLIPVQKREKKSNYDLLGESFYYTFYTL